MKEWLTAYLFAVAYGIFLLLLTGGCSSTNIAELVKAMAGDQATVCVTAQWGGGMVNASRTNIQNGDVQCQPNGLTVKSQNQSVSVPVLVQPGFQLTPSTGTH